MCFLKWATTVLQSHVLLNTVVKSRLQLLMFSLHPRVSELWASVSSALVLANLAYFCMVLPIFPICPVRFWFSLCE